MILTLEVTSPLPTKAGGASRQTFHGEGGTIGRDRDNSWVLSHAKVSGHHAVISYRNAVYYIEDTSRNGVFLNSSTNRLVHRRPYALKSGDRILIDPYEIHVSITRGQNDAAGRNDPSDPLDADDPFGPRPIPSSGLESPGEEMAGQALDPLELLHLVPKHAAPRKAPTAKDLERGSPLDGHYQPPAVMRAPAPGAPANPTTIPDDYDPLASDDAPSTLLPSSWVPASDADEPAARRRDEDRATPLPVAPRQTSPPSEKSQPVRVPTPSGPSAAPGRAGDFATVLAGAGLDPANVTPEVARSFGQILRVVVSGVMDVMRSRQQIKDEFRMRMTHVRPTENNPLKFSANVDDALHNLLVKRSSAYLPPVEAFEDAFADLRHHQVAMLAGMRVAFEAMLAEFDPDRLQQEFDRQLNKGLVPAKLRYWDLYRERRQQILKDPEASFRRLFGERFARAYEDQLKQLEAQEPGAGSASSRTSKPSDT